MHTSPAVKLSPEEVFNWLDVEPHQPSGSVSPARFRQARSTEIDLASDDYLGLARDKRVAGATAAAALKWGAGATGSRTGTGSTELHSELEQALARFCGTQAALVFSSGFTANLGAISALTSAESAIVTDKSVHASLAEGCRLARADIAAVTPDDIAAIDNALSTRRKERALIVIESIFASNGRPAPLAELAELSQRHGAGLLIEDTHGFGVLGEGGRGAVQEAGLAKEPNVVITFSLSAALGTQGGAVLGPRRVIKHLRETARSFLFDSALAPASAAAGLTALELLRTEPQLAERALLCTSRLAEQLTAAGLTVRTPTAAILAVRAPSANQAAEWAARCAENGVLVGCLPATVAGSFGLRLTGHANLSESDVDSAAKIIAAAAP